MFQLSRFELIGWLLFTASACFFVVSSARSGDMLSLAGSVLFLVACFFFMAPKRKHNSNDIQVTPGAR